LWGGRRLCRLLERHGLSRLLGRSRRWRRGPRCGGACRYGHRDLLLGGLQPGQRRLLRLALLAQRVYALLQPVCFCSRHIEIMCSLGELLCPLRQFLRALRQILGALSDLLPMLGNLALDGAVLLLQIGNLPLQISHLMLK
jgi:hypothetical protein